MKVSVDINYQLEAEEGETSEEEDRAREVVAGCVEGFVERIWRVAKDHGLEVSVTKSR